MDISGINLTNYGKRISLEMGTELQVEIANVAMPLSSSLVGMSEDEYLVITPPMPYHLIKQKLYAGNELIVKYLHNGTIYAFQSKLIETIAKPFRLIFLEYPKIIERHELRTSKRAKCFFPAYFEFDTIKFSGIIMDISKRGCMFQIQMLPGETLPSFQIDEKIHLYCKFPGVEGDVGITGLLRNIKKSKQEATLGISFSKSTPQETNTIITNYIFSIFED